VGFVCDANWNALYPVKAAGTLPTVATGRQRVEFAIEGGVEAEVSVKLVGPAERVGG
jgi:hypothetical protein